MSTAASGTNAVVNAVWPLIVLGGFGAFIDFMLGAKGQEKVKDWLIARWVQFDEMKLSNFSMVEAMYFIAVSDKLVGAKTLGAKRVAVALLIVMLCDTIIGFLVYIFWLRNIFSVDGTLHDYSLFPMSISIQLIAVILSFSLTRWISVKAIRLSAHKHVGPLAYFAVMAVHILIFFYWSPLIDGVQFLILQVASGVTSGDKLQLSEFWEGNKRLFESSQMSPLSTYYELKKELANETNVGINGLASIIDTLSGKCIYLIVNCFRLFVGMAIVLGFISRRWFAPFFSLLWQRTIEDQKGPFTVVFGGLGALASVIKEAASHF